MEMNKSFVHFFCRVCHCVIYPFQGCFSGFVTIVLRALHNLQSDGEVGTACSVCRRGRLAFISLHLQFFIKKELTEIIRWGWKYDLVVELLALVGSFMPSINGYSVVSNQKEL